MGCDIHAHIEVKDHDMWWGFASVTIWRDYTLFALMAGVRNYNGLDPIAEPRGVPSDAAWRVVDKYTLIISDTDDAPEGYCTPEDAKTYMEHCGSTYWGTLKPGFTRITHPDWHSASWLSSEEMQQVVDEYLEHVGQAVDTNVLAISNMMNTFKAAGKEVRIIFWFDN